MAMGGATSPAREVRQYTGQRLSERISLRATRLESLRHTVHMDSLAFEQKGKSPKRQTSQPRSKAWHLVALGFALGLVVAFWAYRRWRRLRPQG